jgi:hypothetical protein
MSTRGWGVCAWRDRGMPSDVAMIELFRAEHDLEADRIEDALRDLCAAYRVHRCDSADAAATLGEGATLPALREDERVAWGSVAIAAFLDETGRALEGWRKFQTDACYLDDDGNVC